MTDDKSKSDNQLLREKLRIFRSVHLMIFIVSMWFLVWSCIVLMTLNK